MPGRFCRNLITHRGPALPITTRTTAIVAWARSVGLAFASLQHGSQLNKLCLMLVGMVLAEEKLGSRRQLGAHSCCGTAAVATVCSGQLGTGQSCVQWHWLLPFSFIHSLRRIWFSRCSPIVIGCVVSHEFSRPLLDIP